MHTRRLLLYKLVFHPDQPIPVFDVGSRAGNKDGGRTKRLKLWLHSKVLLRLRGLSFIREIVDVGPRDALEGASCEDETALARDHDLSSRFLLSFSTCGAQNQYNKATGNGQWQIKAIAGNKSGMVSRSEDKEKIDDFFTQKEVCHYSQPSFF